MAIDSRAKRRSALFFGQGIVPLEPDDAITGVDKQDVVGFYRGIATAALEDGTVVYFDVNFYADNRQLGLRTDNRQLGLYHD